MGLVPLRLPAADIVRRLTARLRPIGRRGDRRARGLTKWLLARRPPVPPELETHLRTEAFAMDVVARRGSGGHCPVPRKASARSFSVR